MKYILKRVMFFLITAWAAVTINFILPRLMPGNPAEVMIAKFQGRLNPQAISALEIAFGINTHENMFLQYWDYLGRMLTGNFGISVSFYPTTVGQVLSQAIPWTLGLAGISTVIAFIIGTLLGIRVSWKRNSTSSSIAVPFAFFLNSMPYFWFALIVEYVFAFIFGWFPLGGAYSSTSGLGGLALVWSVLYHAILPAGTIVITAMGGWMLTMRNNMISVLSDDYITFAFAQGLPESEIELNYAARNAILPSFTGFAMAIGFVISGVLLTEIVFSYPGVGYLLYQAVLNIDYPLMQAIFLFITIAVLIANFIADIVYVFLDPRARSGGE
ncbi:ABC transporter permease [Athalassotoga sp.]|uniref:ABC transporter permease n=1 Tax=Athalassotoga sp. TaxID=2022597 RepID=UPI003D06B0CE